MANDSRVKIVKSLIEEGKLEQFQDIFLYVKRTEISKAIGINYTRFLKLVKNPAKFRYEEGVNIARVLQVSPRLISELVHSQLDAKKRK